MRFFISSLIFSLIVIESFQELKKPFTIKVPILVPLGGPLAPMGQICSEPIKMVLDIVNNSTDILPQYNVVVDAIDHGCQGSVALQEVYPFFLADRFQPNGLTNVNNRSNPRLHIFPNDREILFETAQNLYVPPLILGGLCSATCRVVSRTVQFFDFINVSSL